MLPTATTHHDLSPASGGRSTPGWRRWFPGPRAFLLFTLPLLALAFHATKPLPGSYRLEAMVTTDHPVVLQVAYDIGEGFADQESGQTGVPASERPLAAHFSLPLGPIRAVRITPVGGPATVSIGPVSIRTTAKFFAQKRTRYTFAPDALRVDPPAAALPAPAGSNGGVRLSVAAAEEPAPVCTITPPAPVRLSAPWSLACRRWAGFALGWLALWVAAAEGWRWLKRGGGRWWPATRAVWLVAAASVVLSTYPVLFGGRSFLGVDYVEGPRLLYDDPSTLPGTRNPMLDANQGSDIFATINAIAPYAQVQHRAIFHDGEWPLWDRYDEGGLALLGQGQSMFGDPLHFLVIAANGRAWAWDVKFLLAKWLFAAGTGLLVLAATGCLPAALLLTFSSAFIGFFAYRLNHPAYFSVCYSPWILLAWLEIVRAATWRGAMRWAGGLMLANWMEMTSGTAKEAYMLLAGLNATGVLLLGLAHLPLADKARRLGGVVVAGGLYGLLAAPWLLAFFDTLAKSGSSYDNPVAYQLQPGLFVGLFDDMFLREFNWGEGVLGPSLNGLVLLGVLLAAGGARRLLGQRTFLAVALSALPMGALVFGVVPPTLIRELPFLRNIYHVDNTFSCVLLVQCLVLAGFGLKHCLTYQGRYWRRDVLVGLAAGGLLLGAYYGSLNAQQRTNVLFQTAPEIEVSPFFRWYVPGLVLAMLALPFVLRRLRRRGTEPFAVAALVVCLALIHWRMGVQGRHAWASYTPALAGRVDLLARSPAIDRLRADQAGPFRAFGSGNVFGAGYGAMVGIESIIGLDALWSPYVLTLDRAAEEAVGEGFMEPAHPDKRAAQKPFHDLLGVRYYLTMPGDPLPDLLGVRLEGALDLNVYRNDAAWPRAFFVDRLGVFDGVEDFARRVASGDGLPMAEIDARQVHSLTPEVAGRFSKDQSTRRVVPARGYRLTNHRTFFEVDAPSAGVVVLMEPFVDGDMVAEVNGRRAPVWRVDHAFRGLVVDGPGTYRVMIGYVPRGFTWSLWAAAVGLGLSAWAGWWLWRRE